MTRRAPQFISLPAELAVQLDRATVEGTVASAISGGFSDWRLKIEAGLAGVAAWEAEAGVLTDDERAEGEACARQVLGRGADVRRASA